MRKLAMAGAMLVAGCSTVTAPKTELVYTDNSEAPANDAPAEMDANASFAAAPPCRPDDPRNECWVGKRGTPDKPCFNITAFLNRGIPSRDVFAEPNAKARKLGVILGEAPTEEGRAPAFEVRNGRDGWLLIEGAYDDPDINGGADRPMYHGTGWIRGEGVDVSAQADEAFAKPDFASQIVSKGDWFDGAPTVAVLGCDGSWVHGRWRVDPKQAKVRKEAIVSRDPLVIEGWVTGICSIIETTCDGLSGDRPPR